MHSEEIVSALADNYRRLYPLLRYLRARLHIPVDDECGFQRIVNADSRRT